MVFMNNTISSTNNYLEHYKNRLKARCPQYGTAKISFSGHEPEPQDNGNKKLLYAVGGVLVGAGVTGLLALAGRGKHIDTSRLTSKISDLEGQVETLTKQASNLSEENKGMSTRLSSAKDRLSQMAAELQEKNTHIKELQNRIDSVLQDVPETRTSYVDTLIHDYRESLLPRRLDYDPMQPLKNGKALEHKSYYEYIPFQKAEAPVPLPKPTGCFDASKLSEEIEKIGEGETLEIPFAQSEKIKIKKAEDAAIQGSFIQKIGVEEDCDKAMLAGKTTRWSSEKLARDILQNFYDGHGHTLDGVKMTITRTSNGSYKVRIAGQSTYNCKYIAGDGLSSKSENLYDAGGFGEGLKMVNVQLLAKKISDKISYGSADWRYDITAGEEFMRRRLSQVPNFDGNFVEFETRDTDFLRKLVNATNYFEHSKNPDFRPENLIYQNGDMGIAFLGKEQKGNLYMTQRFAYGQEEGWQSLDGLNLFFRRKPDFEFSIGRDRVCFSPDKLKEIIDKFVEGIEPDQALDIIMRMQSVWKLEEGSKTPAYKILLEALCNRVAHYSKKIDLVNEKFAAREMICNDKIIERLEEYGYTVCDECFEKIGMPTATEVLQQYSAHTPLTPTDAEIKKINILGEAVKVVQEIYDKKLTPEILKDITQGRTLIRTGDSNILCRRIDDIIEEGNFVKIAEMFDDIRKQVDKEFEALLRQEKSMRKRMEISDSKKEKYTRLLSKTLNDKISKIDECDPQTQEELLSLICELAKCGCIDDGICTKLQKYIPSLAIIKKSNPNSPVFVFDRTAEKAEDTLAEAMIKDRKYLGHWVSRDHLKNASFSDNLATWLHEMCHQYGGDGSSIFGYKLTDLISDTIRLTHEQQCKLSALEKLYNEISKQQ